MKSSTEDIEQQFAKAVRDYIFRFNMLERNIAYSLSFAKGQLGENFSIEDLLKLSFYEKVSRLKKVVLDRSLSGDFSEWFDSVEHCRIMRNRIVHGHWEVMSFLAEPIRFDYSQMHTKNKVREEGSFTVEKFMEEIYRLEGVAHDFSSLRNKHDL